MVKGRSKRRGSPGQGAAFEQKVLRVLKAQYPTHFLPKMVQEKRGITHKPAADFVGYRPKGKGYIAVVVEITIENKGLTELVRQFVGAADLVADEFGVEPSWYEYVLFTTNGRLIDALNARNNELSIRKQRLVITVNDMRRSR